MAIHWLDEPFAKEKKQQLDSMSKDTVSYVLTSEYLTPHTFSPDKIHPLYKAISKGDLKTIQEKIMEVKDLRPRSADCSNLSLTALALGFLMQWKGQEDFANEQNQMNRLRILDLIVEHDPFIPKLFRVIHSGDLEALKTLLDHRTNPKCMHKSEMFFEEVDPYLTSDLDCFDMMIFCKEQNQVKKIAKMLMQHGILFAPRKSEEFARFYGRHLFAKRYFVNKPYIKNDHYIWMNLKEPYTKNKDDFQDVLIEAAERDDYPAIIAFMKADPQFFRRMVNPHSKNDKVDLIKVICKRNQVEVFKMIIDHGRAWVTQSSRNFELYQNTLDKKGYQEHYIETTMRWLDKYNSITIALFFLRALQMESIEIMLLCVQEGCDLNREIKTEMEKNEFTTYLHEACRGNLKQVVKFLINQPNININVTDDLGRTPFMLACRYADVNMVQMLLEKTKSKNSLLRLDMVVKDKKGFNALEHAFCRLNIDIFKLLLQQSPWKDNIVERQALLQLAISEERYPAEMVDLLLIPSKIEEMLLIDRGNGKILNLLNLAAFKGYKDKLIMLLKRGAPIVHHSVDCPFTLACYDNHAEIIDYFIIDLHYGEKYKQGIKNIKRAIEQGLFAATYTNNMEAFKAILKHDLLTLEDFKNFIPILIAKPGLLEELLIARFRLECRAKHDQEKEVSKKMIMDFAKLGSFANSFENDIFTIRFEKIKKHFPEIDRIIHGDKRSGEKSSTRTGTKLAQVALTWKQFIDAIEEYTKNALEKDQSKKIASRAKLPQNTIVHPIFRIIKDCPEYREMQYSAKTEEICREMRDALVTFDNRSPGAQRDIKLTLTQANTLLKRCNNYVDSLNKIQLEKFAATLKTINGFRAELDGYNNNLASVDSEFNKFYSETHLKIIQLCEQRDFAKAQTLLDTLIKRSKQYSEMIENIHAISSSLENIIERFIKVLGLDRDRERSRSPEKNTMQLTEEAANPTELSFQKKTQQAQERELDEKTRKERQKHLFWLQKRHQKQWHLKQIEIDRKKRAALLLEKLDVSSTKEKGPASLASVKDKSHYRLTPSQLTLASQSLFVERNALNEELNALERVLDKIVQGQSSNGIDWIRVKLEHRALRGGIARLMECIRTKFGNSVLPKEMANNLRHYLFKAPDFAFHQYDSKLCHASVQALYEVAKNLIALVRNRISCSLRPLKKNEVENLKLQKDKNYFNQLMKQAKDFASHYQSTELLKPKFESLHSFTPEKRQALENLKKNQFDALFKQIHLLEEDLKILEESKIEQELRLLAKGSIVAEMGSVAAKLLNTHHPKISKETLSRFRQYIKLGNRFRHGDWYQAVASNQHNLDNFSVNHWYQGFAQQLGKNWTTKGGVSPLLQAKSDNKQELVGLKDKEHYDDKEPIVTFSLHKTRKKS